MSTTAFQKPPLPQVAITPQGFTQFSLGLVQHVPSVMSALTLRPRDLASLPAETRNGLRKTLLDLIDAAHATLHDLEPRPKSDPLPPVPKAPPSISTFK
jgi:hypothetical protein